MKRSVVVIAAAVFISGCSRQDPLDRFAEPKFVPSYLFQPIQLPASATPDECIAVLTNRGELRAQKILKTRPARTKYEVTAVLLQSDAGQKIVAMHPMLKSTNEWYYRIYDVK